MDQTETRDIIRQIVFKLTPERGLHDDLAQEAIIHLWLRESQHPGQTESWYLQSCRFHLQNLLRLGKSVNASKHRNSLRPLAEAYECAGDSADESACGHSVPALVSAKEALSLLTRWLTPREKRVLDLLVAGHSIRDAASRLGISHTSVIRHRHSIAKLAAKLGIEPASNGQSFSPGFSPALSPAQPTANLARHILTILLLLAVTLGVSASTTNWVAQMRTAFPFTGTGPKYPYGRLVQGTNGELYGTTYSGGTSTKGTVFKITTTGVWTTLVSFAGANGANPTYGGLSLASDGNFYGVTYIGGASNFGSIFRISHGGTFSNLLSFRGTNGSYPNGWVTQTADGNFYGTTFGGGTSNMGTIYRLTAAGALTTIASFKGTNGANPYSGLAAGGDGNFYGTTFNGGSNDLGTVFRVTTNGALAPLVMFSGTNGPFPGSSPLAALTRGNDGWLYGTTEYGGPADLGTIFRVSTNGIFQNLKNFGGPDGADPQAGLVEGADGRLYGTTYSGGSSSNGTAFGISTTAQFETLVSLDITNGPGPIGNLALATDGNLYGTTQYGGYDGVGAVLRLVTSPVILSINANAGATTMNWTAFSNGVYRVEYRSTLSASTNWTTLLPDQTATNSMATRIDFPGLTNRFYRVSLQP